MYNNYRIKELLEQVEMLQMAIFILCGLLCLFFIRNLYNLIKKRSYRKKFKQVSSDKISVENDLHEKAISMGALNTEYEEEKARAQKMEFDMQEKLHNANKSLSAIKNQLKEQQELSDYRQEALERYANYKAIDANNTRLGAHFIKNVISHVYQNLEIVQNSSSSILGFSRPSKGKEEVQLSIGALKNMFALLDYNVAAVHKENVTVEEEIVHLEIFIELLEFLKPKSNITLIKDLDDNVIKNLKIKPTLFFPFIENALKHGSLNEEDSFIAIHVSCTDGNQLSYQVENSCETFKVSKNSLSTKTPFGLNALKKLMQTYYPNSTLTHQIIGINRYVAHLKLTA